MPDLRHYATLMSSGQFYDSIGATYAVTRRTEPRIAAQVWAALGDARTVLNVGADDLVSGRWAERNRHLVALEAAELGLRLLIA